MEDDLLRTPRDNRALTEIMASSANLVEISLGEIEMKESFVHGGFGKVYKAKWSKKNVVVKVIRTYSEEDKRDVMQEANLTFLVSHPNVIDLLGITQLKSWRTCIVMEEAEHGSLDLWIGKMEHEHLTKIALGIVDGLKYVHSQNVIHGDIKPKNVLMCGPKDDMIPKLADFGAAKIIERTTKSTKVDDDYTYMAPEVAQHCQYHGSAADIFSLSVMVFEMFNDHLISQAPEEVKRFMLGVHSGRVVKIPKSSKVPVYISNVIERGLNKNPEERPTLSEYHTTLLKYTYG